MTWWHCPRFRRARPMLIALVAALAVIGSPVALANWVITNSVSQHEADHFRRALLAACESGNGTKQSIRLILADSLRRNHKLTRAERREAAATIAYWERKYLRPRVCDGHLK